MSEWLKEHAWKSDLFTRADAHQIPPTHVRSTTSPYNDVRRRVPVNHGVDPGFRGVCDTVLTQSKRRVTSTNINEHGATSASHCSFGMKAHCHNLQRPETYSLLNRSIIRT